EAVLRSKRGDSTDEMIVRRTRPVERKPVVEETLDVARREQDQQPRLAVRTVLETVGDAARHERRAAGGDGLAPPVDVERDLSLDDGEVFVLVGVGMKRRSPARRFDGLETEMPSGCLPGGHENPIDPSTRTKPLALFLLDR